MPKSVVAGDGIVTVANKICFDGDFSACADVFKFTAKKLFPLTLKTERAVSYSKKSKDLTRKNTYLP